MKRRITERAGTARNRAATARDVAPAVAERPNHSRWEWHRQTLLELRDRLLKQRGEQLARAAEPLDRYSMDMADSATDEFDHDMALSNLSADQNALVEIQEALRRIEENTYGVCQVSGKPISAARLKAVPWTRFTKEVEEQLEREGSVTRARLGNLGSLQEHASLAPTPDELEQMERGSDDMDKLQREAIQTDGEKERAS
jgi:RNA polymerase-binding transcription factor DksA